MIHLVIITGLSGSGKSTARKCLEDMGYYTIDNLPVPLVPEFLRLTMQSQKRLKNIAFVMDARIRQYLDQLPDMLKDLRTRGYRVDLIYLDTSDQALGRRFSETRRKHPLSPEGSPQEGVAKERKILEGLRKKANMVIDTTDFNVHQLKRHLQSRFKKDEENRTMAVRISSFGYRYGIPQEADLVFDVRFVPNPFFVDELQNLNGLDQPVKDYIMKTEIGQEFYKRLVDMIEYLVPLYQKEGKAYLHIAIGCTAGRHRSVTFAHMLADHMGETIDSVQVEDRDLKAK